MSGTRRASTSQGLQSPRAQRARSYGGIFGDDAAADTDAISLAPDEPYKTARGFVRIPEDETKMKGGVNKDDARPFSESRLPTPPRPPVRRMKAGGVVRPKAKALPASIPKRSSAETKVGSRPKTRPAAKSRRK